MHNTTYLSLSTNALRVFNALLFLYPEQYRKQFGDEMRLVFSEMYQEEIAEHGSAGLRFWFFQVGDITKSVIDQHIDDIRKKGMKKYLQSTFHINKFNVIGGVLLLPAVTVFAIDIISRIVQNDLTHYNRPVYNFLSHTPLYWTPVLFSWVILFPALAVLINLVPLLTQVRKKHTQFLRSSFLWRNIITLVIMGVGSFFLMVIKLHDFAPCLVHGIVRVGLGQLPHIISVCEKA